MRILAFDTCLEALSIALDDGEGGFASLYVEMARGHQEQLAPAVETLMAEAGLNFTDLDRIGVICGPGSFTGLRVGLAFARGLGFALNKPVVGLGALEALAASAPRDGLCVTAVDARRDQLYLQTFQDGAAAGAPEALTLEDAIDRIGALGSPARLVGSGAGLLAPAFPLAEVIARAGAAPEALIALAAVAPVPHGPPEPLYLRAPDAKMPA